MTRTARNRPTFFGMTAVIPLLLLSVAYAAADEPSDNVEPISPERPGFTNGTDTVAPGHLQFELGYQFSKTGGPYQHDIGNQATLRVPLGARSEVRASLPSYFVTGGGGTDRESGFGDTAVSVKHRFLEGVDGHRPALAVIAGTTLPTGRSPFRSDKLQPSVALESDYNLSPLWSLTADFVYASVLGDTGSQTSQYAGGLCVTHPLSATLGSFLETYRLSGTGNQHYVDGGFTLLASPDMQFDINGGVGLNGVKNDYFVGAGVARRW